MRTKSLFAPENISEGDEWLSPEGHSTSWHRIWDGRNWTSLTPGDENERSNTAEISNSHGKSEGESGEIPQLDSEQSEGRKGKRKEIGIQKDAGKKVLTP